MIVTIYNHRTKHSDNFVLTQKNNRKWHL